MIYLKSKDSQKNIQQMALYIENLRDELIAITEDIPILNKLISEVRSAEFEILEGLNREIRAINQAQIINVVAVNCVSNFHPSVPSNRNLLEL